MALINRNNLLMWSLMPPEADHLHGLTETTGQAAVASLLFVPGETYLFYVPDMSPNSNNIVLVKADSLGSPVGTGTLTSLLPDDTGFLATITVPSGLKEDYYRLRVIGTAGYYYSQRIWYKPSDYQSRSVKVQYSNPDSLFGIPYDVVDDLELSARIKAYAAPVDSENTVTTYDEVTTGIPRTVEVRQKGFSVFIFSADAIGAEGIRSVLMHETVLINGQSVSVKSAVTTENAGRGVLSGKFELWLHNTAALNRC